MGDEHGLLDAGHNLLASLNSSQREAVVASEKTALVLAGPGSGLSYVKDFGRTLTQLA